MNLRVAVIQFDVRPAQSWEDFARHVTALVEAANDYRVRLVVFPEYFTVPLLALGDLARPIHEQVRGLVKHVPAFVDLMSGLARKHDLYIVAGTIPITEDKQVCNDCHVLGPSGNHGVQGKLHMTRWEREDWRVSPRRGLKIFETDFGKFAVAICYDVEFPEVARAAARAGCEILVVPSCTDDRNGFLRVRYCAQARAVENQMYVLHACTVGMLSVVPSAALNWGQSSILTPCDFPFVRDGVLAEGALNQEAVVVGELNLQAIHESREKGTVLTLKDSAGTGEAIGKLEIVGLR